MIPGIVVVERIWNIQRSVVRIPTPDTRWIMFYNGSKIVLLHKSMKKRPGTVRYKRSCNFILEWTLQQIRLSKDQRWGRNGSFLKMGQPRPLFVYFRSFQTNITNFYNKYMWICPSSKWCWDSNPWPLERESPPISTRPGLPFIEMEVMVIDWNLLK